MNSANPVGGPPANYDYYAIAKATVTSVALMALSFGAMKGIQHYAKWTITPLQRNIAGVVLAAFSLSAAARFHGPFTKTPPPSSDKRELPATTVTQLSKEVIGQEGVVVPHHRRSRQNSLAVFQNPIDLTHGDLRRIRLTLKGFEQAIISNSAYAIGCAIPLNGRVVLIWVDISTQKKHAQALRLCKQWKKFFKEGKTGLIPPIQNALDVFREAIRMNGVRFVDCSFPLAGRMCLIRADISSPVKQWRALQACDYCEALIFRSQQRELAQPVAEHSLSLGEPLKTPDWGAFNHYVQQHCIGMNVLNAKNKALKGLQLIQKLHRDELVEQDNLEEKLSDACWGLMLSAITRGQAFVEGTFDLTDPGHRLFNFFMPILYGRSSSHYKKRVIPVTEGYWKMYGHFGYDIGRDGQNDLPAYKRTVMLGRIITRDGTDRTYLKMENWGANLNFFSDWRAVTSAHQVAIHSVEFIESQAKRNVPSVFGEVGGGLNMRKEHMLNTDKQRCQALYQKISKFVEIGKQSIDIDEFGFQDVVPFLREALSQSAAIQDSPELHKEITSFLRELEIRYDNLDYRKGNEVNLGASILSLDSTQPREELADSFILVDDGLIL